MGANAGALSPFEIAIGAADCAAAFGEAFTACKKAQRTAAHPPFKPCGFEYCIKAFRLGLTFDAERTGHDHGFFD